MTVNDMSLLDIEPDEPPLGALPGDANVALRADQQPLAQVLPAGFNLATLLTFLPDVRLKHEAERLAREASAIDIKAEGGLQRADAALVPLRAKLAEIETCFKEPVSLGNQLHKRLTGLRADFCKVAETTAEFVGRGILEEKRRRDRIAEEARRRAQEQADRETRKAAEDAAKEAKRRGAPVGVVAAMKAAAKSATAPPVASPEPAPALSGSTTAQLWKARFKGADAAREPHPDVETLTAQEQEMLLVLLDAIRNRTAPLAAIQPNWAYLDGRAKTDKSTFDIPGVEAYDAGSLRAKASR